MPTFTMTTFETALQNKLNTANVSLSAQDYLLLTKAVKDAIEISNAVSTLAVKGVANGVASLDANVQVPSAQLTNALPSQTGNADKVLSTNGSVAAWTSTLPSPTFTGTAIATNLTASGTVTAALFSGPLTGNVTGSASLSLPLAGGTMTGALTLSGAPSSGLHAATKTYVDSQISGLVNGATGAYDTLKELADLLVADESTAATLATLVGTKAPLASPTFTGTVTIPSGASISGFAPLASPTFTGTVTVPATITAPSSVVVTLPTTTGTLATTADISTSVASYAPLLQTTITPTFTSNAYTLLSTDKDKVILASNSTTAGTITIPTGTFAVGTVLTIVQTGTGQITIATGGTLNSNDAKYKLNGQWASAQIIVTATNVFLLIGNLAA